METPKWRGHLDPMLLAILEDGPRHGYGIIDELRRRSDGRFDLPEGTVYPALHRLEGRRLIDSSKRDVAGRSRRVYQLTGLGARALADGRREWRAFSLSVAKVMGAPA
jgi:DNA-binding PadR family transcriptional regulator